MTEKNPNNKKDEKEWREINGGLVTQSLPVPPTQQDDDKKD